MTGINKKIDPFSDLVLTKLQAKLVKPLPGRAMKARVYQGSEMDAPEVV